MIPMLMIMLMIKMLVWLVVGGLIVVLAVLDFFFFHTLGMGVILAVVAASALIWILGKRKFHLFRRYRTKWLSAIAFAAVILGILAFIVPVAGPMKDSSLGGDLGSSIIGHSRGAEGIARLICLGVVGLFFVAPGFSWRVTRDGSRSMVDAVQRVWSWWRDYYSEHPLHRNFADWLQRQRDALSKRGETLSGPADVVQTDEIAQIEAPEVIAMEVDDAVPLIISESEIVEPVIQGSMHELRYPLMIDGSDADEVLSEISSSDALVRLSGQWQLPGMDLLDQPLEVEVSSGEMERRAKLIEESLASYGVEAKVREINVGPAVTQFGVEPGWNRKFKEVNQRDKEGNASRQVKEVSKTRIKVERIKTLENDIALALAAPSIRIEAPMPGKSLVGIEVPNTAMSMVTLRETMASASFKKVSARSKLALALGKGSGGELVAADLTKMPHLLIAGATGSGKTVCLDSVIASLLMNNTPDDLQFLMIDPKRVELVAFSGVPHLAVPVVTEAEKASEVLKWLTYEMDNRYKKLAHVGANNIDRYNKNERVENPLSYLVLVIDELADLMMAKASEVEPLICRLAQMGRAVGIHEVVATQRPSVDVVTGLIKANFPTRISFAVASQVDSRTILDSTGAEKLLGRGDMLYLPPDAPKPTRLQGCFLSDQEIRRVVGFWASQREIQKGEPLSLPVQEEDPLLTRARQLMEDHRQVSPSFLQRQLRIGRGRAEQIHQLLIQENATAGFSSNYDELH